VIHAFLEYGATQSPMAMRDRRCRGTRRQTEWVRTHNRPQRAVLGRFRDVVGRCPRLSKVKSLPGKTFKTRKISGFLLPEPNDLKIRCPQGRVGSSPSSGILGF